MQNRKKKANNVTKQRNIALILNIFKKYPYGASRGQILEQGHAHGLNLTRTWYSLIHNNVIQRIGYNIFIVNSNNVTDSSLYPRQDQAPAIDVNGLQLAMPIIEDRTSNDFWDKEAHVHNWTARYKKVRVPIGLTIQKNTKQVQVHVWRRDVLKPEDIESLALRASVYAWQYLHKHGLIVDIFKVERKNLEIAIKDKNLEQVIPAKDKIKISLGREARPLFDIDKPQQASAWTDSTPKPRVVETNDITYAENYLRTPEMVNQILEIQKGFAENLQSHLKVLADIGVAIQELRDAIKEIKK